MRTYLDVWRQIREGAADLDAVAGALGADFDAVHEAVCVLHLANIVSSTRDAHGRPERLSVVPGAEEEGQVSSRASALFLDVRSPVVRPSTLPSTGPRAHAKPLAED